MATAGCRFSALSSFVFANLSIILVILTSDVNITRIVTYDSKVLYYPGLQSHPQHELALKQQTGFGGVLSFRIKGGKTEAWKFIDGVQFLSITANLGDAKSTITHPATTTHGRLSDENKIRSGITDNLIRISVGLESVEDIKKDMQLGFVAAGLE